MNNTFSATDSTNVDYYNDENPVLEKMQRDWNKYGTHLFPSAVINDVTFRGQVTADNVFESACSAFTILPHGCRVWLDGIGKIEGI